jgi:hypothetical protein
MDDEKAFEPAARLIIDPPPEWLPVALAWFSSDIASMLKPGSDHFLERMRDACDTLMKGLPAYLCMPFELRTQETEVARLLLGLLPTMKDNLDRLTEPHRGPKPDVPHMICAAVVVKAWELIHGKPEPRSEKLYEACELYWQACGGSASDIANWRRHVEAATVDDTDWIRKRLLPLAVHN